MTDEIPLLHASLSDSQAIRLSPICDQFEDEWRENHRPEIEEYLQRADSTDREMLLRELLSIELEYRLGLEERPAETEYSRRFPQHTEVIRAALRSVADSDRVVPANLPKEIGDYELIEVIGRGGMGIVCRARQRSLGRVVALKMIRSGEFASAEEIERFRAEAEAAARLDHPGIVAVFEVGESGSCHYFSMALIEGPSLATRLADGPFVPKEAATIVCEVAEAVQYAHSQGVIHRDLKPSNILCHKGGRVVVSDFGLAKQVDDDSGRTKSGQIFGTASYMPPEQAQGDAANASPSCDVYSLGAVLYALLTGRPPFAAASFAETIRQVVDTDVVAPRSLNPTVPTDLETICLKCLNKEPSRRYGSAAELADDLRRWLDRKPIVARPVGPVNRVWRWCRRNSLTAGLLAAVLLLLLATTTVSTASAIYVDQARRKADENAAEARRKAKAERFQRERAKLAEQQARQEASRATHEAKKALELVAFLKELFRSSDPVGLQGVGFRKTEDSDQLLVAARIMLDAAAQRINSTLTSEPLVRAALLDAIGDTYRSIGIYERAEPLIAEALEIRSSQLPDDHLDVAESLFHLGWLRFDQGNWGEAERLYREALTRREESLGTKHLEVLDVKFALAWLMTTVGRDQEAEHLLREVLAVRERELGSKHEATKITRAALALTLVDLGRDLPAITVSLPSFENERDVANGVALYYQAISARKKREYSVAEQHYRKVIEIAQKNLGAHPLTAMLLGDFAGLLRDAGKRKEGEQFIRQALEIGRRIMPHHPLMIGGLNDYGDELRRAGKLKDARAAFEEALEIVRLQLPKDAAREADLRRKIEIIQQQNKSKPM